MKIQNVCNLHLRKFVNIASRVADTIYLHPLIGGHHCQLDNQCRDPMKNNKDCRVGQLTTSAGSTSVERFPQDNSCNVLFLCQISNDCPWCWCHLRWVAPCVVFEWTKTAIWAPPPPWMEEYSKYVFYGDPRVRWCEGQYLEKIWVISTFSCLALTHDHDGRSGPVQWVQWSKEGRHGFRRGST